MNREWVQRAACYGQDHIMFDPQQIRVALDLCASCEVTTECATMLQTWERTQDTIPLCVVAGTNRFLTKYGYPRQAGTKVVRPCITCDRPMYLEIGSTKEYCSVMCDPFEVPVDDIRALSRTLDLLLETAT